MTRMAERERVLWMGVRQVLIMALGLVEDYLALPRSIVPRRRRVWQPMHRGGAEGFEDRQRSGGLRGNDGGDQKLGFSEETEFSGEVSDD